MVQVNQVVLFLVYDILQVFLRSSHLELFFNIGVLKKFEIVIGKHRCWILFFKSFTPSSLELVFVLTQEKRFVFPVKRSACFYVKIT